MQVERTLVKSPPELWAEISDVEALTRHLARFGEISITRVEPESKVAWEGEHARGTVELTASGWGTKVRLDAEATAEPVVVENASDSDANSTATVTRRRWLRFWRRPEAEAPAPEPPPTPELEPPPIEAVLTQVLDDLGQAHHRPFSR